MNNSVKYEEIDILKGIAIIFVLLGHAIILFPINLHEIFWCSFLFKFVSLVHMPLFFIVSGFCYKPITNTDFNKYISKKIKRLLVPYFVFNLIDISPRVFLPQLINRPMSMQESLYRIIFKGGEFWFLYVLFSIFLIFPIIQKLTLNNKKRQIIFFLIFLILTLCKFEPTVFLFNSLLHYLLFFYCGYLIKIYYNKIANCYNEKIGNISSLKYILFCIWLSVSIYMSNFSSIQFIGSICGLIFIISMVLKYKSNIILNNIKYIGQVSLQLYLLNGTLLLLSRSIAVNIFHIHDALSIILLNMVVTLGLSYLIITKLFMRYKITKALTGII